MFTRALQSVRVCALALLAAGVARAQLYENTLVDPFEVRSSDGQWTLFVDPSSPQGQGPAKYRLSKGDEVRWQGGLPCTLSNLVVDADGAFAGAAQQHGERTSLRLLLIGPDGKSRFDDTLPFEASMQHGSTFPYAAGAFADPERDGVTFRIAHYDNPYTDEEWRTVRWSSGERVSSVRPVSPVERGHGFGSLKAVQPIAGTPLLACYWSTYVTDSSPAGRAISARVQVLDADAHVVWGLDLPHDHEGGGDEQRKWAVQRWARGDHVLRRDATSRFGVQYIAESEWVTFEVGADVTSPSGWSVREIAREPHAVDLDDPRKSREAASKLPALPLTFVGTIELQGAAKKAEEFYAFDIDDRGRLGRVADAREKPRFGLRDKQGALVADLPLELGAPEGATPPNAIWLRGDRWLVYLRTYGKDERAFAWWLDLPVGTLTAIEDFDCAPIEHADGTFDGGFVALTAHSMEYTIEHTLSSFDAQGKLRWRDVEAYGQSDSGLFSAEDVRVSPRGEIGVLDNIRHEIQRFDTEGKLVSSIDLDALLGREANYPTELGVTPDGDWVVYDFNGSPPVLRVSRESKLTSTFAPHFADGRVFHPMNGVQVAPDGRLWATDGYALLRLDDAGAVDLVVGDAPDTASLGDVERSFLDATGRALLADKRTHAVHVFDADGKRVAICSLPPTLVNSQTQVGCIAVSADGRVHVGLGGFEISEYVVFEANGASAGDERVAGESHFAPSSSLRWSMRYKQIDVFDGSELRKSITRSPDNKWLDAGSDAGVSADGSLALLSRGKLHVYSGDGEPVMSLDAPGIPDYASIAFADARVFLGTSSELWCVDLVTHATRNATLGEGLTADSQTCMAWRADVSELWILDESAKKVLRYRVPR